MPVPAAAYEALGELACRAATLAAASGGNLLECFAAVPDPRDRRGIRHSLACVLALCTAAVLCGNTAIEDVTAWVHAAQEKRRVFIALSEKPQLTVQDRVWRPAW